MFVLANQLNQHWSCGLHELPTGVKAWLMYPASLTQRLRTFGARPKITILKQAWGYASHDEQFLLKLKSRQLVFIREVLIGDDKGNYIFARSLFPAAMLSAQEKKFKQLGSRILGNLLFKPQVRQGVFQYHMLKPGSAWHAHVSKHLAHKLPLLWARRRCFYIKQKSLLVTEVFLPAMKNLDRTW